MPKRRRAVSSSTQDLTNQEPQAHDPVQMASPSETNPESHAGHAASPMIGQQNSEGKMLLLPLPRRTASMSRNAEKNRTTHACDLCRKAKAKCTGGQPCQKCKNEGKPCFYGDGKRDKERKILERTSRKYEVLRTHTEELRSGVRKILERLNLSNSEQEEIAELLDKSPPSLADDDADSISSQYRSPYLEKNHGEFYANGDVGSTGSLDVVAVDTNRDEETRATGFLGKSSSVRWIQRAEREVHEVSSAADEMKNDPAQYHGGDPDLCQPVTQGDQDSWKYELPETEIATKLVDSYFAHVHQDFPILSKDIFLKQFRYYTNNRGRIHSEKDHMALCQINCVFAISSTFAVLAAEHVELDPRCHLVYYARTRALGLEVQPTNAHASLEYVCSLGLMGLYLVSNYFINRAWVTIGHAVRNAQTFGLHVRNKASGLSDSEKEHRNQIWWSLFSLEHFINEITGRPSCISQGDVSAPHSVSQDPKAMLAPERKAGSSSSRPDSSKRKKSEEVKGKGKATEVQIMKESQEISSLNASPSIALASDSYFSHRMAAVVLTHEILSRIFSASTVNSKWNEVQDIIREIEARLQTWKSHLPDELKFPNMGRGKQDCQENQRKGLEIIYHAARMILYKPALCRMDDRIKNESSTSIKFHHEAVVSCIESARAFLAVLGKPADPTKLYLIRPWWEMLHRMCQAAGILMLEISFSAIHVPEQTSHILQDAKDAIHWLRAMSGQSIPAYKAWRSNDRILRLVGTKVGADMSDMLTAPDFPPGWDKSVPASINEQNVSSLESSGFQGSEEYRAGRLAATTGWANSFPQNAAAVSPEFYQPTFPSQTFQPGLLPTSFTQGFEVPYSAFDSGRFPLYEGEDLFGDPSHEMMQGMSNPSMQSYSPYSGSLGTSVVDMGSQSLEGSGQTQQNDNMTVNRRQSYRDFENSFRQSSTYGQRRRPPDGR